MYSVAALFRNAHFEMIYFHKGHWNGSSNDSGSLQMLFLFFKAFIKLMEGKMLTLAFSCSLNSSNLQCKCEKFIL